MLVTIQEQGYVTELMETKYLKLGLLIPLGNGKVNRAR